MASGHHGAILQQIHRAFGHGTLTGVPDEQLLERFLARHDATAFEAIVVRLGPMVWGVCRRVLHDSHDAEDAFQATFLVLLRRAGSLRDPGQLSPWVYGVATRVAARTRINAARRREQERKAVRTEEVVLESPDTEGSHQLSRVIDEEIERLPEKYRKAVVLCHIQGMTYEEAARQLRWTPGAVRGRLSRAREKLRRRLTIRGVAPSAALTGAWLSSRTASAVVPPALEAGTFKVVGSAYTGGTLLELTSKATIELMVRELRNMLIVKVKAIAGVLIALSLVGWIATRVAGVSSGKAEPPPAAEQVPARSPAPRVALVQRDTPANAKADAGKPASPKAIEIIVVAKDTGKPLAGASVRPSMYLEDMMLTANSDGHAFIDLSKRKFQDSLSFDVWADGHVQQRFRFSAVDSTYPRIPAKLTVSLLPGEETIGGIVKDEEGRPIAGAFVDVWGHLGEKKDPHELCYLVRSTTDAQGRWQNRSLRKMKFVNLYLSHPDFLADDARHARNFDSADERALTPSPKLAKLRDRTDVQVMTRGIEIRGQVIDPDGRPVAGATVGWIEIRDGLGWNQPVDGTAHGWIEANQMESLKTEATATTDKLGRFVFPHVNRGNMILTAKTAKHAPALLHFEAKPSAPPAELRLLPANTLSGRVLDGEGRPVSDAFVAVASWRGFRGLRVFLATDAEGRFSWNTAPADSVLLNVLKDGYLQILEQPVTAAGKELAFTLKRALTVTGVIKDAQTGHRVKTPVFVELGSIDPKSRQMTWVPVEGGMMSGDLRSSIEARPRRFRYRITAVGYEPFESREIGGEEGTVALEVALKKDPHQGPSGIVVDADGKPVAGAEVVMATLEHPASLQAGRVRPQAGLGPSELPPVKTGANGRFKFPRVTSAFKLAVLHDSGFARLNSEQLKKSPTITLQAWGRVEGRMFIGDRPAASQEVLMASEEMIGAFRSFEDVVDEQGHPSSRSVWSIVQLSDTDYKTKTDAEGRFAFDRVPPIDMTVYHVVKSFFANSASFKVNPGQTMSVTVGGAGRPVTGHLVAPERSTRKLEFGKLRRSIPPLLRQEPSQPPYPEGLSTEQASEWLEGWWNTPDGKAYRAGSVLRIPTLGPDGRFRAEDVPPGNYSLVMGFMDQDRSGRQRLVATLDHRFKVPEIPGGRSNEALDLGAVEVNLRTLLDVGQAAPPCDFVGLDGIAHELTQYRGKFVLLNFWATASGACVNEIPHLKGTFDAFGKDDRFVMISLNMDDEAAKARDFLKGKDQPWIQGYLGEWSKTPVPEKFQVGGIPANILIGPDGKVIARDLQGEAIKQAVAQALTGR